MQLKRADAAGRPSQMGEDLRHEAAMRVQARMDAEEALRQKVAKGNG